MELHITVHDMVGLTRSEVGQAYLTKRIRFSSCYELHADVAIVSNALKVARYLDVQIPWFINIEGNLVP